MAISPVNSASPEDLYPSSDQEEAMDTDSEADEKPNEDKPPDGQFDPEVDSSINMEISDNEDPSDKPGQGAPLLRNTLSSANGSTSPVKATLSVSDPSVGLMQENANNTIRTSHSAIQLDPIEILALGNIRDLKEPLYGLNIPIWQRILSFVPPQSLGRLLQTSRKFHALLDPTDLDELALQKRFRREVRFLSPEAIWQSSRNRFLSNIPKPLKHKSELDMYRMIYGRRCQICHQVKPLINAQDVVDPWHAGPGDNGLRLLWICATLICGRCLPQRCQQEVSLQLSSTFPSFLIKALTPLFLTQNNDWIPQSTLLSSQPPAHLQIQKFYYQSHIDRIVREFEEVKCLGGAAAEEWLKGLESQFREHLNDANRWEQWELTGGLHKLTAKPSPKPLVQESTPTANQAPPINFGPNGPQPALHPPYMDPSIPMYHPHGPPPMPMMPPNPPIHFHGYQPPPPPYGGFQPYASPLNPQVTQGKPRRSLQEVNEARAVRRQEIERRCLLLEPPITAKVLSHMQSFQAALQISFPFTDNDWEILKPRLLAQRDAAEAQETVLAEQLKAIQATAVQPPLEVLLARNPHELSESEWEQLQSPVREALLKHAEQFIDESWEGGSRVNSENVTQFAPEVLLTVRNKYYENLNQQNPMNGSQSLRIPLSLESIKWLYDNKVKNTAEVYQKDLFQCSACDSNSRFYGFEGVIQHFAAKHTTALSLGNIIVNWRTEWPESPPFHPVNGSATGDWKGSFPGGVRPMAHVNPDEYGQSFQLALYPQQGIFGGVPQQPPGFGAFPQARPFYGQSDTTNYGAVAAGYPNSAQVFTQHPTYGSNAGVEQGSQGSQVPYMPSSAASELHRKQLTEMAAYSRDLWNATMGIKELPAGVRVFVLVHHMSIKFSKKFGTAPDISMFLHGLNENAQMRPIRSLNGLSCKICKQGGQNSTIERKSFTLPALVNHFKNAHLGQAYTPSENADLDWRIDMIELPDTEVIENLVESNGMDDRKFNLIAEAFPDIFPSPLPTLSSLKESRAKAKSAAARLENLRALNFPLASNVNQSHQSTVKDLPNRDESRRTSQDRLPSRSPFQSERGSVGPPRDDEYDPSRNTFIGDIVEHSGFRRSSNVQKPADVVLPPGIVSLGVVDDHGQPESPYSQGGYADRLLRHHRGQTKRPAESSINRDGYDLQEYSKPNLAIAADSPGGIVQTRHLQELPSAISPHGNHNIYNNSAYSPVEDYDPRRSDHAVHIPSRAPRYMYSPPRYGDGQSEHSTAIGNPDPRSGVQTYGGPVTHHESPSTERRWEAYSVQPVQIAGTSYQTRDRSRSPRRSLPREQSSYDPQMSAISYEARDVRWRGDSPPRNGYYRGQQENTAQASRPGDSFIGRDAQGRNVRYVAIPVEEYESQLPRYPPARAAVAEPASYLARSNEMMEVGPDGRLYVVNGRGPVQYERGPIDETYRDYR